MNQKVADYFETFSPRSKLGLNVFDQTRQDFIDHFYNDEAKVRKEAITRLATLIAEESPQVELNDFVKKLRKSFVNKRNYGKHKRKKGEEFLRDHRHPAPPQTLSLQSDICPGDPNAAELPPADDRQSLPPTPPPLLPDACSGDRNDLCPAEPPPAYGNITLTVKDGVTASKLFQLDGHPTLCLTPTTPAIQCKRFKVDPAREAQGKYQLLFKAFIFNIYPLR